MASAKKCDRCGKEYRHYGYNPLRFNAIKPVYRKNMSTIEFKTYNLCPKCAVSFEEWLMEEQYKWSD
jgi:hypothetical protein